MASLNKMPGYEAQLPRTPHDLSRDYHFTSSVGMMLPIYQHILNPSETINLECSMFTRSNYLSTAAMAEIDFKIDWFFVPMQMLYTPFEQIFYGTDDFLSSASLDYFDNSNLNLPLLDFVRNVSARFTTLDDFINNPKLALSRYRLLMHLGLNPNSIFYHVVRTQDGGDGSAAQFPSYFNVKSPNFFPWQILAYNAIYYKYYRLQDYVGNVVNRYNFDLVTNGSVENVSQDFVRLYSVPKFKDYFTSVKISPISSVASTIEGDGSDYRALSMLNQVNNFLSDSGINVYGKDGVTTPEFAYEVTQAAPQGVASKITTGNIRSMFAVEKLLRIFGRASKTYDAQILAHFGWKVPHDVKHQLTFLGSFDGKLDINQVLATADTEQAALGSIVGNGYGNVDGKKIKFTAPVHGVLMGIYYSRPKVVYEQSGFEKINAITDRLSFYQPEFDHLGMQPIYGYESDFKSVGTSVWMGWQFRYEQFKRKYDIASVAFSDPNFSPIGRHTNNAYCAWVLAKRPFELTNKALSNASGYHFIVDDLYVRRTEINNILSVPYVEEWSNDYLQQPWLMFQTDPFIHWLRVHCTLVSPMSKYGEPELDC